MVVQSGTVFGRLTVIREIERSGPNRRFLCRCDCGSETVKFLGNLRLGRSRTCGCEHARTAAAGRAAVLAIRRARAQESDLGRMCLTCQTWKPWESFRLDPRRPRGRTSNCVECGRWRGFRLTYGINRADWTRMYCEQSGGCALCGEPDGLVIDHDHACCGATRGCKACIRGLLCDFCNRVLGRIEQKPELAARFADYLARRPLV